MSVRLRPWLAAGLVLMAAGLSTARAAQAPVAADGARVVVRVTVTDKSGRFVTDLSKDDFSVLDKSKPQPILDCRRDERAITLMLMLDRSGSLTRVFDRVNYIAEQLIERLGSADRARVTQFSEVFATRPSDFTGDHAALVTIVNDGQTGRATRMWDALDAGVGALENGAGARTMVVISDGDDTGSRKRRSQVTEHARDTSAVIHAVGVASMVLGTTAAPSSELRAVAEETGGQFWSLKPADDVIPAVLKVAGSLRGGYLLAFAPTLTDGKRHAIEVRVGRPGLQVQTGRDYLAVQR
jgi:VWFA-related protein